MTNPPFIKKLNLLIYYFCRAVKLTKGKYGILCLSLFRSCRFAGYKQFLWWIRNRFGKGVRKVIPSCTLWSIGEKYPSADGSYIPFKESCDYETGQLYGDNWYTLRINFRDHLDLGANQEGLSKLLWWHKISPIPCRHKTLFQRLFDITQTSNKLWNNIMCLQG